MLLLLLLFRAARIPLEGPYEPWRCPMRHSQEMKNGYVFLSSVCVCVCVCVSEESLEEV